MRELNDTLAVMSLEVLSALKLRTIDEPLLPNLETLHLWGVDQPFNQFIPFFLSLRVTSISLAFDSDCPKAMVASMVSSLPTLCPHIQKIYLGSLPTDPTITAAVSGIVLAANLNTLQEFHVDSPLTEEASEVVYELPSLRNLSVVIGGEASLPSASLPNLTELLIRCDDEGGWPRLFHGATLGKLKSVKFCARSEEIGDFLGAFERAALSSSVQNTLSEFYILGPCSWIPNYSSLLSFTQMVDLDIVFLCHSRCSSTVDDDIVISLSRAMPKLTGLQLGYVPCGEPTSGVTVKGLVALALHCPDLQRLCIHFQVASLSAPSASSGFGRNTEPTGSQAVCALKKLVVGYILVPEESALMVALTLLQIFPRIENIKFIVDRGWGKVKDAIRLSKRIVDCSSKQQPLTTLK